MKARPYCLIALLFISALLWAGPAFAARPDLVLLITVDQLRGDMPWRLQDRLAPKGFRYFLDNGAAYTNAHYSHVITTTAAGHATLATGGNIPQHGIAGNEWFDMETRKKVYNTADPNHPVFGTPEYKTEGRSPRNLTSSTYGDELVVATGGKSRVFSVSIKDRAAILLGGHLGKAHWYQKTSGDFVSSSYYYEELPAWMQRWNDGKPADQFVDSSWELLLAPQTYTFIDQDDRPYEKSHKYMGRTFPHRMATPNKTDYYSALRYTPMGDQLTLQFAKTLVAQENIGKGADTDILAVSFSVTDYIGHAFGPYSLEAEDNLLRLDRTLQELLEFIDQEVGLKNTLVVLTSDHGVSPIPEHMAEMGIMAKRHDPLVFVSTANTALQEQFSTDATLILAYQTPGIYLDEDTIKTHGLELENVERTLAKEMMKMPGFSLALTKSDLLMNRIPDTAAARSVASGFHPTRSGHVILVQDPFWFLGGWPHGDSAMHGSPYSYDTHVPIMIAGPGIGQGAISQRVAPHDLAPTITGYLGVSPPSGSTGNPLPGLDGGISVERVPIHHHPSASQPPEQ